jgi:oligosaccharyltransferase complex subunit alpha (ribophorin I)
VFREVTRTIEISHWGNIGVTEDFHVVNEVAELEGEFGRVDFVDYRNTNNGWALRLLETQLPRRAKGLWYGDIIGNVSTSLASRRDDGVKFTVIPRFPLMGGWQTKWSQGYNLPTKFYLYYDEMDHSKFVLNYTFFDQYNGIVA